MQTNTRKKIEDQEELVPGTILEINDQNTGTWVVGLLLNVYDSELHNGLIVNILRPDGTTVDIDCVYADVYTAPNYNINHFCRTLQRYLYETQEKEKLLMRGIRLCKDAPLFSKTEETLTTQAFVPQDPPLTVYIDPTKVSEPAELTSIRVVGWLKDDINSSPAQLCLATWKGLPLSGRTEFYSVPLETINGERWITSFIDRYRTIASVPENLKTVQKNLDLDAVSTHTPGPKARDVRIVKKMYPVKVTLTVGSAATPSSGERHDVIDADVDEDMWFQMGWQPKLSISKYDPMFLVGTRWLKRGDEPDCWVFLANKQGEFKFVVIPMTKPLEYATFEAACAEAQCKVTDLISDSDLMFIDSVIGRYTNDLIEQFSTQYGGSVTLKKRLFAPIRIMATTKMSVPQ